MYQLVLQSEDSKFQGKIKVQNLKEFYEKTPLYQEIEEFHFARLYNNLDYNLLVLEPCGDDFLILHVNILLKDIFGFYFPDYVKGRLFGQLFPKFSKLNTLKMFKSAYENDTRIDTILKLYQDNKLLFALKQFCIKQDNLLYLFAKEDTEYYLKQINEEKDSKTLDEELYQKQMNINFINTYIEDIQKETKTVLTVYDKNGYHWLDGIFNVLEIKPENRVYHTKENFIFKYVSKSDEKLIHEKVDTLSKDNPVVIIEYKVKTETNHVKYLRTILKVHDSLNGNVYLAFTQDFSEEIKTKKNLNKLTKNLSAIQRTNNIAMATFKNNEYTWTSEIYNILELNPEDYSSNKDLIKPLVIDKGPNKFYEELKNLSPKNPNIYNVANIRTPKGNEKILESFIEADFDDNGNMCQYIGFVHDVTEETLIKDEALRLRENFNFIQSSSKIFIAEYKDGHYSFTSEVYNILGINPVDYPDNINVIEEHVLPEDKDKWIKFMYLTPENPEYQSTYRVKSENGDIKYLFNINKGLFDENGKLIRIIGFLQDITEETLTKKEAIQLKENLETIEKTSQIVIGSFKDGKYYWTSEIYNILEISSDDYSNDIDLIELFALPDNKDVLKEKFKNISPENPHIHSTTTIKTPTGKIKILESYINANFNDNGELIEFVTFIQEITDTVNRERELKKLSEDRNLLIHEVHHRVKNNLQLILSFLNLESRYNVNNPEYIIEQTRNRIGVMALTHEEAYQSESVSNINLKHFLTKNLSTLFRRYKTNIKLFMNIEPVMIDIDKSIPLGLLLNEMGMNVIKHAYPENNGDFHIDLNQVKDNIIIKIWDNGVGLPEDINFFESSTLGFVIIRKLAEQLEAELNIIDYDSGFGIELIIPN